MSLGEKLKILKEEYRWIPLSHPVHPDIPRFPVFDSLDIKTLATVKDHGFLGQEVSIGTQLGTHIDAPFHFVEGKKTLADFLPQDKWLELVVLHLEEEVAQNSDYEVTVEDIKAHEKIHGRIPENACVVFASGWSQYFDDPDQFYNKDENNIERTPGWSLEALKFLSQKRGVAAIGHETINTDAGFRYAENESLEAEYYWLSENKFQLEVLNRLSELPSRGAIIVIGYPNIIGISGFTVDVVAIAPKDKNEEEK